MAIPYSYGGLGFGNNLGLTSSSPFVLDFKTPLLTAQTTAIESGNKNWQKILEGVLKYGGAVVGILVSSGVIKNRNVESLTSGDFDQQALSALLNANGGTLNQNSVVPQSRSAIDLSRPIVLLALGAGAYLLLKK